MEVTETPLPGVLLLHPRVFRDDRGSFVETWREARYAELGLPRAFVQDNAAMSRRGVIRGLHYQHPEPQGKLVTVLEGEVFDVVVDVRRGSPTFGEWHGATLRADSGTQLWVPEGFAHGYAALSERALLIYKCTRVYDPGGDRAVRWDDPEIGIEWPVQEPALSEKDAAAPRIVEIEEANLPGYDG